MGNVALTQGRHQEVVLVGGISSLLPLHLFEDVRQGRPLLTSWAMIVALKAQREHLAEMTWLRFVQDLGTLVDDLRNEAFVPVAWKCTKNACRASVV